MRVFIYLFIFILPLVSFAQDSTILSNQELSKLESQYEKEIKDSKLAPDKKLIVTLIIARELYQYRFYDKALSYFDRAIEINSTQDKSEAYINRVTMALIKNDQSLISKYIEETQAYFTNNPKYYTAENKYYIDSVSAIYSPTKMEVPPHYYASYVIEAQIKVLMKLKKYPEALVKLNALEVASSKDNSLILSFDLLRFLTNAADKNKLLCKKQFDQYPKAYTYSSILCGLVIQKISAKKIASKDLKRAEIYFKEDNPSFSYLFDLFKEIK